MNIEEARAAIESYYGITSDNRENFARFIEMLDAYGAARELKGHVGACGEQNETPDLPPKTPVQDYKCPDGSHHSMTAYPVEGGDVMEVSNCTKCGTPSESVMMRRQASKANPQRCGDGWYCDKAQTYMFPVTDREDST